MRLSVHLVNTHFHRHGADVNTENAHLANLLATPYNLVTLRQVLLMVLTEKVIETKDFYHVPICRLQRT